MFRLSENWTQLRESFRRIYFDFHSSVRASRVDNNNNVNQGTNSTTLNLYRERQLMSNGERPIRLDILLQNEPASHEEQVKNSWSLTDKSPHINIQREGLIGKRRPVVQYTDCMRGRNGYTHGLHVWTIKWPANFRGTHAMVGVATADAPLYCTGYCSLLGSDGESWGWDLMSNKCYHDNDEQPYPKWLARNEKIDVPDQITTVLDIDEGTLGFIIDNVYLGVAFSQLKGKKLFPIVSTVWGNGEIGIKYESYLEPNPLLLKEYCRQVIRKSVGKERMSSISDELELPNKLKNYIIH